MQYLQDFLHSIRIPVHSTLESYCRITKKIDGCAFQVYNDNGNIIYGKRSNTLFKKSSNRLTIFDMIIHIIYYNAYKHLSQFEDIFKQYKVLNFEIFSTEENNHVIKYNGEYKNDIVLLSGIDLQDNEISEIELQDIANKLNISLNEILWKGRLLHEHIEYILEHKDDNEIIWNIFTDNYCKTIKNKNVEGIVLTFTGFDNQVKRQVKIYNPLFKNKLDEHLKKENKEKEDINLEYIYDIFINGYSDIDDSKEPITKLLELYMACEVSTIDFYDIEKSLEKVENIKNVKINTMLASEYYSLLPNNIKYIQYPMLLSFILVGFRNKRTLHPLWCSQEYQLNKINPFLDKFIFNCKNKKENKK